MKTKQHNKGFALIEVMIAALVLTVGCLAFLKLQRVGVQYAFNDYARSQGVAIAQGFAEKLRGNVAFRELATQNGSITSETTFTGDLTSCSPNCAQTLLDYQSYLTGQQMKMLIKGDTKLCYQKGATIGSVRLTFMWVDNNNQNATINCPAEFNSDDTIENAVTIYAQL